MSSGFKFDNKAGTISFDDVVALDSTIPATAYLKSTGSDGVALPVGSTASRPISPDVGTTRWNTDLNRLESFSGSDWIVADPASVLSVNGQTGTVVLTNTDVGAAATVHTHVAADILDFTSAVDARIPAPDVVSVNGKVGTVVLSNTDVGAAATVHTHVVADITDFSSAFNTSFDTRLGASFIQTSQVNGLDATLASFNDGLSQKVDTTSLATVATSGQFADLAGVPSFLNTLYVSKNGNDAGTGAWDKPFATVQAAHDYAVANVASGAHAVIVVMPGSYPALNVTRPRTSFIGLTGMNFCTTIGATVIASEIQVGASVDNTTYNFENISFSAQADVQALGLVGSVEATLILTNVRVFAGDDASGRAGIVVNNTSATKSKIRFTNVDVNSKQTGGTALDLTNVTGFANTFSCDSGAGLCVSLVNGQITFNTVQIESTGGTTISVGANGQFINAYGILRNNQTNAVVINMAATAIASLVGTTFITNGATGFAVQGVAGSVLQYGYLAFASPAGGAFTTQVSAAITAAPLTTTFTPV